MYIFLALTLGTVVMMARSAWKQYRDPLHPAVFISPLLAYSYVVEPFLVIQKAEQWFFSPSDLHMVLVLNFGCIAAFSIGITWRQRRTMRRYATTNFPSEKVSRIAVNLGLLGFLIFCWGILNVGGLFDAYARAKGGGRHSSGYLGEAMNLGLIAAMLIGIVRWKRGLRSRDWLVILLGVAPNLIQGTLGGRRGPLFLALGVSFLAWVVSSRQRLKPARVIAGVCLICLAVLFSWSQRSHLHLGSEDSSVNWDRFASFALVEQVDQGNNFIYGSGLVVTTWNTGEYSYGKEIFVNIFIRPIPSFLWRHKYRDVGADWITTSRPGFSGFSEEQWLNAVGWIPFAGSSAGSVSDLFGEFGWFSILAFLAIGFGFRFIYIRHSQYGGLWSVLMLEATVLTIYLATQSFSAFYHRFLLLAVPSVILWRFFIQKRPALRRRFNPLRSTSSEYPRHQDHVVCPDGAAENRYREVDRR